MLKLAFTLTLTLAGLLVVVLAQSSSPKANTTQQKVVLSYLHDVLDGRKIGLLENLFHPDCVIHRPEGTLKGLAGIRGVVERNIARTRNSRLRYMTSSNRVIVWSCVSRIGRWGQVCFAPGLERTTQKTNLSRGAPSRSSACKTGRLRNNGSTAMSLGFSSVWAFSNRAARRVEAPCFYSPN